MTDPTPPPSIPGVKPALIARVKNILLKPKDEWAVIDAEPATIQGLYVGYAALLAAIPAVASFLGLVLFGIWGWRPPIGSALGSAVTTYLMSLVGVAVTALVIEFLAPQFGAEKNRIQAFKVATYSATAGWVAGVFYILPGIGWIAALAGLYGLYLMYLGIPRLMKAPADKAVTYTIVAIVVAVIVLAVTYALAQAVTGFGGGYRGYGYADSGRVVAASQQSEAAATAAIDLALGEGGPATARPVAAGDLSTLLPAAFDGFRRGETGFASGGLQGLESAEAHARYTRGDAVVRLSVVDLGVGAAFAALGVEVDGSRRDGHRYETVATVDGRMTTETWDGARKAGGYSVLVARRFVVEAEGDNVEMADLKAAARAVPLERLEAMARRG